MKLTINVVAIWRHYIIYNLYYNKADDESSNKKHLDLYYILISQKLSIF